MQMCTNTLFGWTAQAHALATNLCTEPNALTSAIRQERGATAASVYTVANTGAE